MLNIIKNDNTLNDNSDSVKEIISFQTKFHFNAIFKKSDHVIVNQFDTHIFIHLG